MFWGYKAEFANLMAFSMYGFSIMIWGLDINMDYESVS